MGYCFIKQVDAERFNMTQPHTVLVVKHRTTGEGRYEKCPTVERKVVSYHMGGTCTDDVGDIWRYRVGDDGKLYTTG
jgi:hypothetical protein